MSDRSAPDPPMPSLSIETTPSVGVTQSIRRCAGVSAQFALSNRRGAQECARQISDADHLCCSSGSACSRRQEHRSAGGAWGAATTAMADLRTGLGRAAPRWPRLVTGGGDGRGRPRQAVCWPARTCLVFFSGSDECRSKAACSVLLADGRVLVVEAPQSAAGPHPSGYDPERLVGIAGSLERKWGQSRCCSM